MLVVRLFGELRLELDGECVHPPTRRSGRMLLGYLALHRGMHARGDLAALIWPDILESSARASLRSAIAAIRRTLGTGADLYLLRAGDTVGLAGADAGVSVDLERFETLAAAGELEAALGLSQGSLLQGLDAEWVRDARVQHAARVSELLGILASDAERSGSLEDAIRYTRRQVALSPLAEPPNRELIRRLAAAGDRASALMVYGELAERFRRELQAVPSAETRRLASEARRGPVTDVGAAPLPLPPVLDAALRDPFVDRVAELSELSSSLARAAAGQRQTVLVVGEPGIGKSALLARFAAVAAPSATVLFGHCRRPPSTALEPFVEALRHYVTAAAAERLERELPAAAGELAGLVPGIAERLVGVPLPPDLLEDGGRIARAVVETLLALSRARPLVLFLEDLHEGDAATVQLLARLVAGPEPARLMVVSTLRDTELGRSTTLQRLTRELRALPGTLHMALDGLDASAIGDLARAIRSDDLAPGDASRLHSRTHGNPFFAARLLESDDPLAGWPLPERVEDLVWEEIARLSADAQNCLAVAATVGVEFDLGGVMRVAGYGEDRALDALDEAVVAHVVRELPSGVGRYEFRHELIRDVIYTGLTATRRAHLHRRVAEFLEDQRREDGDPPLRAIVEHLRQARDLVPAGELADRVVRAADAAAAERTHADAAALYAEAVDLLADRPDDAERRCRVLIALGHARRRAAHGDGVETAFFEAAQAARDQRRPDLLISAALGLCAVPFSAGDRPVDLALVALLEEALEAAPDSDTATRARLLARLAGERYYDPLRAPPVEVAEEAAALARRANEPAALIAALDVSHLAFRGDGGTNDRLALARELVGLARKSGDVETLVPALVHQTVAQVEHGDLKALETNADALTALASELRQPAYAWWALLWRATAAIVGGRLGEGEELAQHAHAAGRAGFGEAAELELRAQLVWLRLEREQLDEVAASLPALEGSFSALPVWDPLKARVLAGVGRSEEASVTIAELTEKGLARLGRDTNWPISAWLLAETFARTGEPEGAARLHAALEPRAAQWAVSARGTVCFGPLTGALALLSAVEGRIEEADRYYTTALERSRSAGALLAVERLQREYKLCRPEADGTAAERSSGGAQARGSSTRQPR